MRCASPYICVRVFPKALCMAKLGNMVTLYAAGILQGAAFVLVPSLGTLLAGAPYHYSARTGTPHRD